jgi:hypothetical protein
MANCIKEQQGQPPIHQPMGLHIIVQPFADRHFPIQLQWTSWISVIVIYLIANGQKVHGS